MRRWIAQFLIACALVAQTLGDDTGRLAEERFCRWMTERDLADFSAALDKAGFYPIRAEGRLREGRREFRIAFDRAPQAVRWWYCWYFNADADFYRKVREKRLEQGYEEIAHQEFAAEDGAPRHQVVWRKFERTK